MMIFRCFIDVLELVALISRYYIIHYHSPYLAQLNITLPLSCLGRPLYPQERKLDISAVNNHVLMGGETS